LFTVPKSSFSPQPGVESAVVRLTPVKRLDEADETWFLKIAEAMFAMRRKTLANCLKALLGADTLEKSAAKAVIAEENTSISASTTLSNFHIFTFRMLSRIVVPPDLFLGAWGGSGIRPALISLP
jgi:16S rRNA A1518/A1519 N6-dimethyltransferase RsmA/KsgA/DIM1 with predicted DNA glycosylase/AP lyase activity